MQVKQIMTVKPSYCEPYWTVEAVASLMDHAGAGILPVVENVLNRRLLGVVTDRDLCVRVVAPGLYPAHTWVQECMTRQPVCSHPEDNVETVVELMKSKRVRRVPVVNENSELQGMLSITDVIRADAVSHELAYSTLKHICESCAGVARPRPKLPEAA